MIKLKLILLTIASVYSISLIYYLTSDTNQTVVISDKIEIRDGLIYKKSSDQPFTGTSVDTVGDKIIEYDVKNGIRNGRYNVFNADGSPQITGIIKNNRNNGLWIYYFPDGSIECTGFFKNDKISEKWIWYYPNGKIMEEGFYIDGVREGSWVKYDPDGNIYSRISFKKDIIINEINAEKFSSI